MDSIFGEINLEPASRAFHDDYEDSDLNLPFNKPILQWKNNESVPKQVDHFVLIEGSKSIEVTKTTIAKQKGFLICWIEMERKIKMEIYKLNNTVLCIAEENDLNYFSSITELLSDFIKVSTECSIISLQRIMDFKAIQMPKSCHVTSYNSKFSDIPALESPNFFSGISAGVATRRHLINLPYSCYTVYVDIYDVVSLKIILELLKRIGLSYDEKISLRALHHKSDLYM